MRARLHVRGWRVGFFREGTHDLCDARATRQLLPATCDALDRLVAAIRSLGADLVREIELSENVDATERVVHLETSEPLDPRLVEKLVSVDGLTPGPYVTDAIAIGDASLRLRRHVLAFFQGNRYLLSDLVAHVVEHVPVGSRCSISTPASDSLRSPPRSRAGRASRRSKATRRRRRICSRTPRRRRAMATLHAPVESVGAAGAGVLSRPPARRSKR